MKAFEIMNDIIGEDFIEYAGEHTVDTLKAGNPEKEISKIRVCLTATPEVLRQAKEWGADLLITHEPTYYNHRDEIDDSELTAKKVKLVEESGVVLYRYHDSMHSRGDDEISEGFLVRMGWQGEFDGKMGFLLDEPKTPLEIATEITEELGLKYPRIVGCRGGQVKKIFLALGSRGKETYADFCSNDYDVIIGGELCEWRDCEPVRDLAQMGIQKTIIILGHAGSERDGVAVLAEKINGKYDGAEAKYFECGEIYSYVD